MMKSRKMVGMVGALCCLGGALACAGDEAEIAEEAAKMVKVDPQVTKVESPVLDKVLSKPIYKVKFSVKFPDQSSTGSEHLVIKGDEGIVILEDTTTDKDMPLFGALFSKDFKLSTMEDAKVLESALDEIYPISDAFGRRDKKAKKIIQDGQRFVFVRGEFFKKLKGFVFEVDGSGSIQKVSYSLGIKPE